MQASQGVTQEISCQTDTDYAEGMAEIGDAGCCKGLDTACQTEAMDAAPPEQPTLVNAAVQAGPAGLQLREIQQRSGEPAPATYAEWMEETPSPGAGEAADAGENPAPGRALTLSVAPASSPSMPEKCWASELTWSLHQPTDGDSDADTNGGCAASGAEESAESTRACQHVLQPSPRSMAVSVRAEAVLGLLQSSPESPDLHIVM